MHRYEFQLWLDLLLEKNKNKYNLVYINILGIINVFYSCMVERNYNLYFDEYATVEKKKKLYIKDPMWPT